MNRLQIRHCVFMAAVLVGGASSVKAQETTPIVKVPATSGSAATPIELKSPNVVPPVPVAVSDPKLATPVVLTGRTLPPRLPAGYALRVSPSQKVTTSPAEVIPVEAPPLKTGPVKMVERPGQPVQIEIPTEHHQSTATSSTPKATSRTSAGKAASVSEEVRVPAEVIVEKPVALVPAAANAPATIVETPFPQITGAIPEETQQPEHARERHESPEVPRFRAEAMATLPDTYKDPTHLFSGAESLQLREAEETRRDYLIGEVSAMLTGGPEQEGAKVLVRHAYSECQADGFWHVVEDTWYDAGGGQVYKRRTYDKKTDQPCKDANGAELPEPPQVRQLTSQVMQPQEYGIAVEDGLTVELKCENGLWYRYVYRRFRLQDGSHRRHHSPERIEHTNVPCDQPRPPAVGGPVRIIDAPPLEVSRTAF